MPWCKGLGTETHECHQEEPSKQWEDPEQIYNQTLYKLMSRRINLWNKDITTILTAPVSVRTSAAVLNSEQCSTGSQYSFSRTGVVLVYLLVFDHCNLCRLNLEKLLKRK